MNTVGNGNRDSTPFAKEFRKIKRISFEAFLNLKGFFKNYKWECLKTSLRVNEKGRVVCVGKEIATVGYIHAYEPTEISCAYNSSYWQWQRVAEWDEYINDPLENKNGHIII